MQVKKWKRMNMKTRSLRIAIFYGFIAVILFFGVSASFLGVYTVKKNLFERAQAKVKNDLRAARSIFQSEIESVGRCFWFIKEGDDLNAVKEQIGLDYLFIVTKKDALLSNNMVIKEALKGKEIGAPRIIEKDELLDMGEGLFSKADIAIEYTPKARPTERKNLESVMAIEYAKPLMGTNGQIFGVIYGGKIINKGYSLVDKVRSFVFSDDIYDGKPIGTVTIFQDDVRVSTNVLNRYGKRAIGTRVSSEVFDNVISEGKTWTDRAFVVTDWYITAYEPIRDIQGKIIGILYVGTIEKPFNVAARNTLIAFITLMIFATVLAIIISMIISAKIAEPLISLLGGTSQISSGDLTSRVGTETKIRELNKLAGSFNNMVEKLDISYKDLKETNSKLSILNKRYLDLISFVSHELKGILASTILNAYSVRDGFLGMVNFKQQKALDSITRNLDYLEATVKNFLSLSRIEKGEMKIYPVELAVGADLFDAALDNFNKQITEKNIIVENNISSTIKIVADRDLLLIVINNLISNAIKYGEKGGTIKLESSEKDDSLLQVSVYNDGVPIPEDKKDLLFKRFSRLDPTGKERVKGTGLGLFIAKEIVEAHGGTIRVESTDKGNSFIFSIKKGDNG